MGITALWGVIKDQDRSVPIAQLAEDHFKRYGRPLRIAVDEADWRHNNLTTQQVYMIREKSNEPAFQGIEKSMFHRICRLLTLNVQLLFVFDGPSRPWKRGRRGGGKINYEERRLLKKLLKHFRILYHEAPGEAEAECARLQQLHIVDAVFSQDSDTLMFGCSILVRDDRVAKEKGNNDRSKENTRKSGTSVRVVYGQEIQERHNLDREGLVLFAMLCGGDYDTKGLPGCGPAMAVGAVRAGLGKSLCQCTTRTDCMNWRDELSTYFQTRKGHTIAFPPEFPNIKILDKYNRPKVSSDDQLEKLRYGWDALIDELELLDLTSTRFNIWGRGYMNWIGPVLLTKFLVARDSTLPKEVVHQIKLTKQRAKKDSTLPLSPPLLRSLTFSPFGLTTLLQKHFEDERAGYWTGKAQEPFEPELIVKADIPTYLLQKVLPANVLDPPPAPKKSSSRKRKRQEEDDTGTTQTTPAIGNEEILPSPISKRPHIRRSDASPSNQEPIFESRPYVTDSIAARPSKKAEPMRSGPEYISLLSDSEEDAAPPQRHSSVIDLGDSLPNSEDEDEDLVTAIPSSSRGPQTHTHRATALPPQKKQHDSLGATARQEKEPGSESLAHKSPLRTESNNVMETRPSNLATGYYSALRSDIIGGHSYVSQTRSHATAVVNTLVDRTGNTHGPDAAHVRTARLRFFTSDNTERSISPSQAPRSSQGAPPSKGIERAARHSFSSDVETIDLT